MAFFVAPSSPPQIRTELDASSLLSHDPNPDHEDPNHLPHSNHTANFMDVKPALDSCSDTPTPSRYHQRGQSLGSMTPRSSSSLSVVTDDVSISDKFGTSGLKFDDDELWPDSPDTLHTIEAPFPRHGPCRYITDANTTVRFWSVRGLLNFGAVFLILAGLIFVFVGLPLWKYFNDKQSIDTQSVLLAHQSGPFLLSELPQHPLSKAS